MGLLGQVGGVGTSILRERPTRLISAGASWQEPHDPQQLAGDALVRCHRRVQQDLHGHRGRKDDPLYRARRTLHTGHDLLTDRQRQRLTALFGVEDHVQVEATWASTSA